MTLSVMGLPNTCFVLWKDYKMQGIQFSTQGITGIQAGVKTMFREPIVFPYKHYSHCKHNKIEYFNVAYGCPTCGSFHWDDSLFPKYKIGETVFVQEEFAEIWGSVVYKKLHRTSNDIHEEFWRPASEMTEQQSRITLKITNIKVEYLQDISEQDAKKEGAKDNFERFKIPISGSITWYARYNFMISIWEQLPHPPKYQWSANPRVFAYTFEVVS